VNWTANWGGKGTRLTGMLPPSQSLVSKEKDHREKNGGAATSCWNIRGQPGAKHTACDSFFACGWTDSMPRFELSTRPPAVRGGGFWRFCVPYSQGVYCSRFVERRDSIPEEACTQLPLKLLFFRAIRNGTGRSVAEFLLVRIPAGTHAACSHRCKFLL